MSDPKQLGFVWLLGKLGDAAFVTFVLYASLKGDYPGDEVVDLQYRVKDLEAKVVALENSLKDGVPIGEMRELKVDTLHATNVFADKYRGKFVTLQSFDGTEDTISMAGPAARISINSGGNEQGARGDDKSIFVPGEIVVFHRRSGEEHRGVTVTSDGLVKFTGD